MRHRAPTGRRDTTLVAASAVVALLVGVLLVGVLLVVHGLRSQGPPEPPLSVAGSTGSPAATPTTPSGSATSSTAPSHATSTSSSSHAERVPNFGPHLPPSAPVSVDIPSVGIRSSHIVELGIGRDGVLEAPTSFATPGWYAAGPTPGELGPFVIAGHVDSRNGPAVFYRIGALHKGSQVMVKRADGTTARFTIDDVGRYRKTDFPTERVYGNVTRAEIRLITCGGAFDHTTGHYVDNIVAFGHLLA